MDVSYHCIVSFRVASKDIWMYMCRDIITENVGAHRRASMQQQITQLIKAQVGRIAHAIVASKSLAHQTQILPSGEEEASSFASRLARADRICNGHVEVLRNSGVRLPHGQQLTRRIVHEAERAGFGQSPR